jgi:tRNA (mo5U34)-methyltransferase
VTLQSQGGPGFDGEIAALGPWFHNLKLPGGEETAPDHPLGDFPAFKWSQLADAVPADLTGQRALDIGCNAGFYSFELARRGAEVLAVDHDDHYLAQARWARDRLGFGDRVEIRRLSVYDLARISETFDVVLFMGVLYHLRYPLLALDLVTERVRGRLILQTLTIPGPLRKETPPDVDMDHRGRLRDEDWPAMAFVEHALAGDPTNWWVPNASAVEAMLRTTGMRVIDRPGHEIWVCERKRTTYHRDEIDAATGRAPSS